MSGGGGRVWEMRIEITGTGSGQPNKCGQRITWRETSNKLTLIKVRNTEDDDRTLIRVWMMWSWMSFENAQTGSK